MFAALIVLCAPQCRLAQAVMQWAEVPLRPYLQRFLTIIIVGDPNDSELKDQRLDVIMQARPAMISYDCYDYAKEKHTCCDGYHRCTRVVPKRCCPCCRTWRASCALRTQPSVLPRCNCSAACLGRAGRTSIRCTHSFLQSFCDGSGTSACVIDTQSCGHESCCIAP